MKRMMKKLMAGILISAMLISGGYVAPEPENVQAAEAEGELLDVEYRSAHDNLQAAAEEAMGSMQPTDFIGIVVHGEHVMDADDFSYLNTNWNHASVIDLGKISVENNEMGYDKIIGGGMPTYPNAVQVKTLTLPETLEILDQTALYSLPNLEEVEIPASVTEVRFGSLYYLPALKKVSYHGAGVTSINQYVFSMCNGAVTLDFSNATGLENVSITGNVKIVGFDFTGCTSLTSVDLSGMYLDFSGGKEEEWLKAYDPAGEKLETYNDQKPMLAISADPVAPLELNGEFSGAPALKGLLLDGETDVLAADAVIPDWIAPSYIEDFSDSSNVSVKYIDPFGVKTDTLNTSVGGTHTIQWSFKWIHPQLDYTTYELPVEVIIPEDQKMMDVYLDPSATSGNGTVGKPLPTLPMALSYLKQGGTLHLLGDVTLPEGMQLPKNLTIKGTEGENKPVLTLEGNLSLSSDLTVDGVQLKTLEASENQYAPVSLYANGHTLTFGEHMSNAETEKEINIYGGGTSALSEDTHLVMKGGNFANVSGGCYLGGGHDDKEASDGTLSGNTHIEIGGSAVIKNVYGGGYLGGAPKLGEAKVDVGDTYIEMTGGKVGVLYGGGFTQAEGSANAGSTHVTVTGGEVRGIYGGGYASVPFDPVGTAKTENVEILLGGTAVVDNSSTKLAKEAVYGGGYANEGDCADVTGDVKLTIQDNASMRAVYGGGYVFSNRDASARVGGNVEIFYDGGKATRIYGGGNYSEYDYNEPMENAGVGGAVNIYARGGDLTQTDLWGKGSDGDPAKDGASIHISGYGTDRENPEKVSALYHFDTLILDNSHVLFPANVSPNLSCDNKDGRNIEMKNDSSMTFEHSISGTFAVNNLMTDGDAAITLHLSDTNNDSAIPLTVNGTVTVSKPIALKLVGTRSTQPESGNKVFITTNAEGNDSLVSDKFSLQNEEFRLIKKEGALQLTLYNSLEKDEQDPPKNLTGIAPSRYGGEDGIIQDITEAMEYATSADGEFTPWTEEKTFAAGTYYVRYAEVEGKKLPSKAVEVTVPEGQHTISYHVENGRLGEDAPLKVEHGDSFEFQWKAEEGYMLDWSRCSATGGDLSHEGNNFKVENVTEDVTVTIVATEIPGMVKIKKPPHDVRVRAGHAAVFELTAEGEGEVKYQWYANKGRGFTSIAGETGPMLTTEETAKSADGYLYYCVVSNTYGSVTSETVELYVLAEGETIEAQEQDNAILGVDEQTHVEIGEPLSFTVSGAEMDNKQPAQGDTRFVPLSWTAGEQSGSWEGEPYTITIQTDGLSPGQQAITIIFVEQRFNGEEWEPTGTQTEKTITVSLDEKKDDNPQDTEKPDEGTSEKPNDGASEKPDDGNGGNGNGAAAATPSGKDDEPQTSDVQPLEIYATLSMIAGLSYLLLEFGDRERGMSERKKKLLTAAIVAWGKQGGRLRRMAAIIMLFVLLLYYHSIGKRMNFRLCVYNINAAHLRRCRCAK